MGRRLRRRLRCRARKPIVTIHDPELTHALKEVDRAAMATAETPEQVGRFLGYVRVKE